jgi:hypothetical protein
MKNSKEEGNFYPWSHFVNIYIYIYQVSPEFKYNFNFHLGKTAPGQLILG